MFVLKRVIDLNAFVIIAAGLITHNLKLCFTGVCPYTISNMADPSIASNIVALSVSLVVFHFNAFWPSSFKKPNDIVKAFYNTLMSSLVVNLVIALVWDNIQYSLRVFGINNLYKTSAGSGLDDTARFMYWTSTDAGFAFMRTSVAMMFFVTVLFLTSAQLGSPQRIQKEEEPYRRGHSATGDNFRESRMSSAQKVFRLHSTEGFIKPSRF